MMRAFNTRRDAEELQTLLEQDPARATDAPGHRELVRLAALATSLREVPPVEPRPEFSADLRERLMAEAATVLAPAAESAATAADPGVRERLTVPHTRTARERRLATLIGGAAVLGATTSMAVAAQSAMPGDVLYPLKRAIENAHTGVSVADHSKGSTLLGNATDRLAEVEELSQRSTAGDASGADVEAIESTLGSFSDQAAEASDLLLADYEARGEQESLDQLGRFTAESFARLDALAAAVPEQVRDALVQAGDVLAGIEEALRQACPTCEVSLTQVPHWLVAQAGPVLGTLLPPTETAPATLPTGGSADGSEKGRKGPGGKRGPGQQGTDGAPATVPGAVPTAGSTPGDLPQLPSDGERTKGPVGSLVEDLTTAPSGAPTLPVVPDLLEGVGDLVDELTEPLLQPLTPPKP